jgi:hypothetical protein
LILLKSEFSCLGKVELNMKIALIFAALLAALPAAAQPGGDADRAYDNVVAARKALQQAEMAQEQGVEPREGERQGIAGGKSRLGDEYWQRQESLQRNVEAARKRLDEALARWHQLR